MCGFLSTIKLMDMENNKKEIPEDEYVFHAGEENETRLKWMPEECKKEPPFLLKYDIHRYVGDLEWILDHTHNENDVNLEESRYRGLNNVLSTLTKENGAYLDLDKMKLSNYYLLLDNAGINMDSYRTLEAALPHIRDLVNGTLSYTLLKGNIRIDDWWLSADETGHYPGEVILHRLWRLLDSEVRELDHRLGMIGRKPHDIEPAWGYTKKINYEKQYDKMKKEMQKGRKVNDSNIEKDIDNKETPDKHVFLSWAKNIDIVEAIEKEIDERVDNYLDMAVFATKERSIKSQHNALCRLMLKIARDYPYQIMENPGHVLYCPKVKVTDERDLAYGEDVVLDLDVYMTMFYDDEDFNENIGYRALYSPAHEHVRFLTLALWYEILKRRERLDLRGEEYDDFDEEIKEAIERGYEDEEDEEEYNGSIDTVVSISEIPHYCLGDSDELLKELLKKLIQEKWVENTTKSEDWIFRFTGRLPSQEKYPNWTPSKQPITFFSLNQCRYIVKNLIYPPKYKLTKDEWDKVRQVFESRSGNMDKVNTASKTPSGCASVDELIKKILQSRG